MSLGRKVTAFAAFACAAALLIGILLKPDAEKICETKFIANFGETFKDWALREKYVTPAHIKLLGTYSGGRWACNLENTPVKFDNGWLMPSGESPVYFKSK